eukprot:scaffold22671_cov164-Cylindrotheca_fusiformis.AAC.6
MTFLRKRRRRSLVMTFFPILIAFTAVVILDGIDSCQAIKIKMTRKATDKDKEKNSVKRKKSWDWRKNAQNLDTSKNERRSLSDTLFRETVGRIQTLFAEEDRPLRDMWDGLQSAFSIAWSGYYQGFEGLVFDYPWRGMSVDGALGWFQGLGIGVVHFGAMTFSGFSVGLYQAARGIESAYEAVSSQAAGMRFDKVKGWFFYSLDEEVIEQQGEQDHKTVPKRHLRKRVKDHKFYDILNVETGASPLEIKKAYYRQALETHPDKNHEDLAADDFLALTTAYKTLISEETRELYDKHGRYSWPWFRCLQLMLMCHFSFPGKCFADYVAEGPTQIDPYIFFGTLFRSSFVQPYVGDLAVATIVDNALMLTDKAEQVSFTDSSYDSKQQIRRQLQIARHLRDRIESYVIGEMDEEQFRYSCRREAVTLGIAVGSVQARFLFKAISSGLIAATYQCLLPPWMKKAFYWASGAFDTSEMFDTTQSLRVMVSLQRELRKALVQVELELADRNSTGDVDDCNEKKSAADVDSLLKRLSVPKMVKLVWRFNMNDIARTVREASRRVLDDCGDSYTLRLKKARAMNILGKEFHTAVAEESGFVKLDAEVINGEVQAALLESIVRGDVAT